MGLDALWDRDQERLEDFWGRRDNRPRFVREVRLFGRAVRLSSNHEAVLAAIDRCLPLYSTAAPADDLSFSVQLVVQAGPVDAGSPPDDLDDYVQFTGEADWLALQLGRWGRCHVDLTARRAWAVLLPPLAQRPDLVARCLLNTVLTNFFIASGFGVLHASCLIRDDHALLLMAPHHSGKSTTALRLALAGYPLLSDGLVFLTPASDGLELLGFPVGKIKLRRDVLPEFPRLRPLLSVEPVGGETKYSLDLRQLDPALVYERAASPSAVELCLLARSDVPGTHLGAASGPEVWDAVMDNSLFYDSREIWLRNLAQIRRLVDRARCHHLVIGSEPLGLAEAVATLWTEP